MGNKYKTNIGFRDKPYYLDFKRKCHKIFKDNGKYSNCWDFVNCAVDAWNNGELEFITERMKKEA